MTKTTKLNDKQRRFVEEYVKDSNATQAAIRAGYSAKAAGAIGHRLIKKAEIRGLIDERLSKIDQASAQQCIIDRSFVLQHWKKVVEVGSILVPKEGFSGQVKDIEGNPVFKLADANSVNVALNNIAKHLRMYDVDPSSDKEDDGSGVLLAPQVAAKDEWK